MGDNRTMKDETSVSGWDHSTGRVPTAEAGGERKQEPMYRQGRRVHSVDTLIGLAKVKTKELKGIVNHSAEEQAS